jgi:hypothetical protein
MFKMKPLLMVILGRKRSEEELEDHLEVESDKDFYKLEYQ